MKIFTDQTTSLEQQLKHLGASPPEFCYSAGPHALKCSVRFHMIEGTGTARRTRRISITGIHQHDLARARYDAISKAIRYLEVRYDIPVYDAHLDVLHIMIDENEELSVKVEDLSRKLEDAKIALERAATDLQIERDTVQTCVQENLYLHVENNNLLQLNASLAAERDSLSQQLVVYNGESIVAAPLIEPEPEKVVDGTAGSQELPILFI
jgi:hypothetical protein